MRHAAAAFACFLTLACSAGGNAGAAPAGKSLALDRVAARAGNLIVTSPAFSVGGPIPKANSDYGGSVLPGISWTGLPPGTRSIALVVEDPDAAGAEPFVHWLAWNADPAPGSLAAPPPAGLRQGRNGRGTNGYFGPHPPAGPAHHYHFEVFALDHMLDLAAGADRAALVAAMDGHVLAKGELVGMFARPRS